MTEPQKFFKVDDSIIYQDGFSYSFHRILDPAKSSAYQIQLHQVFYCALREEENCRSRCHVTGNWEMDKKGRKFMLGIVKKGDHTHGKEYRETIPKLRFYKSNDDETVHRNGFVYTFYRQLDAPKQIADFRWDQTYRCAKSDQENCRARIYTTGQWEVNKRELRYQLGIFKNCYHNHESEQNSRREEKKNIGVKRIVTSASSSTRAKDIEKREQIRFYKYRQTTVQHGGFVYNFNKNIKGHPQWRQIMWCGRKINGKHTCNGYIWTTGKWDEDDRGTEAGLKFYQYMDKSVHRDGHVYCFGKNLKSNPPWKQRMVCTRTCKRLACNGYIWTTGQWETDKLQRHYQRGILKGGHSHDAYEKSLHENDVVMIED